MKVFSHRTSVIKYCRLLLTCVLNVQCRCYGFFIVFWRYSHRLREKDHLFDGGREMVGSSVRFLTITCYEAEVTNNNNKSTRLEREADARDTQSPVGRFHPSSCELSCSADGNWIIIYVICVIVEFSFRSTVRFRHRLDFRHAIWTSKRVGSRKFVDRSWCEYQQSSVLLEKYVEEEISKS